MAAAIPAKLPAANRSIALPKNNTGADVMIDAARMFN